jgi:serine/threonine protein kinase/Tfp pilus assembly protein PilF
MVGQTISHYHIIEKLGEGGMGVVYKAQDLKLKRLVALKFLTPYVTPGASDRERFIQEAQAAAILNHPNVATVYEIDEADGRTFIAMEYVEGNTLKSQIANSKSRGEYLPIQKITDWGMQIADALGVAHDAGIIHRDIKSENIMITKDGRVKVMDFGLAKLKGGVALTKTRSTVGTLGYMSPEQVLGQELDQRTDLWSFGVVLYELITGEIPFRGEHEAAVMYEILNVDPEPLDSFRKDVPESIRTLLAKLLQKDRSKRVASAKEILDGLKPPATSSVGPAPEKSIAVLYFENMSSEKESDYFCAGMTEDILTNLSRIRGLQVVSRTDVLPFRNKEVNIRQVGEALRVKYVVEGSVRKAGNKIRITAQLIDVQTGFHLWADRYDRLVDDIFEVQDEVSHKIAEALKISLSDSEEKSMRQKPTDDLRAYDSYMRGRELLSRRGRKNNEAAIQMFGNAVAIDPHFASAYAGLAEAYSYMYEWYDGSSQWLGRAIEMNQKALDLDPTSLEAKFGIAMTYFYQKRYAEAKRTLEAIIQENAQFYPAYLRLGTLSEASNDVDSALRHYRIASELKPHDEEPWMRLDSIYRRTGNMQAAHEAALKVVELTARKLEASLDDIIVMSRLAQAYARFEAKPEAHATLKRVFEIGTTDGLALYSCACAYSLLGEKDQALISLRRAFESGFRAVANWAKTEEAFDSLRTDADFKRLIAELE